MSVSWQEYAPELARDEASKRLFLKGLEPVAQVGERLRNPDMAETLTLLAADPAGFYTNHLGDEFIQAAQAVNNVTGKLRGCRELELHGACLANMKSRTYPERV